MTYEETLGYIKETNQYGSVLGLDNIYELLKRLDNPQNKLKFVHLAGTNGKGSTAAYIGTILAQAGYKVGRYISPAIFEYRERIQISRIDPTSERSKEEITSKEDSISNIQTEYISENAVAKYITLIKNVIDDMIEDGYYHPTPFEIETAMSFLCFLDEKCDIVILETGLGGSLDATNIVQTTICSVITSISMDHMQLLGDTIRKIAEQKAGIIKSKVPVVSYEQVPEVLEVLREKCKKEESELIIVDFNNIKEVSHRLDGISFYYESNTYPLENHGQKQFQIQEEKKEYLRIRILGEHQVKNAALAIETIQLLRKVGYFISNEAIVKGLLFTKWEGRFDIIKRDPILVVDGAHNVEASISLRKSIQLYFNNKRIIFIIGVLCDKEYESVIKNTVDLANLIITITPDSPRALSSNELAKVVQKYHDNVIDAKNVKNALKIAEEHSSKDDVIISFGSLSYLGEIYQYYGLHK